MTDPQRDLDQTTAMSELEDADLGDEHPDSSFAQELAGHPGMESDESTPSDRGGAGGLDPEA